MELKEKPLVSIITAVFNGASHIREAIESVLSQDYEHIEYIVIDGGSTDGTQDIIKEYLNRITYYISEPDDGISDAWNKGIAASSGEYIGFLNADDYYSTGFVRRNIEAADGMPGIVYGKTVVVSEGGERENLILSGFKPSSIRRGFGFRHPSSLVHRSVFGKVGEFDVKVRIACDTDFLLRCVLAGVPFRESGAVVYMRRGGISDRAWSKAAHEYISRLQIHGLISDREASRERWLVPVRLWNRNLRLMPKIRWLHTQAYFIGLRTLNFTHSAVPFALKRILYKLCKFRISSTATVQGGVRFFHVGRLAIGAHSVVNRGVYLDNRGGITVGSNVSIAHDAKIYTMGHALHDDLFSAVSKPVIVDDFAVIFAGAMIMPGVRIGRGAVVMAGAVVTKDVEPFSIVGGNPAKALGVRDSNPVYQLDRRFWFAH